MATYWITFRIENVGNHGQRRQNLMETIAAMSGGKWWVEPTSFVLFETDSLIDYVAEEVAGVIDVEIDLALIGMPFVQSARALGAITDPDLYRLMPFTKKV